MDGGGLVYPDSKGRRFYDQENKVIVDPLTTAPVLDASKAGASLPHSKSLSVLFAGRTRRAFAFDVKRVPREIALKPVLQVRRHLEFVILARIDNQLSCPAKLFERLIRLLAAKNRHVPVDVTAHE